MEPSDRKGALIALQTPLKENPRAVIKFSAFRFANVKSPPNAGKARKAKRARLFKEANAAYHILKPYFNQIIKRKESFMRAPFFFASDYAEILRILSETEKAGLQDFALAQNFGLCLSLTPRFWAQIALSAIEARDEKRRIRLSFDCAAYPGIALAAALCPDLIGVIYLGKDPSFLREMPEMREKTLLTRRPRDYFRNKATIS